MYQHSNIRLNICQGGGWQRILRDLFEVSTATQFTHLKASTATEFAHPAGKQFTHYACNPVFPLVVGTWYSPNEIRKPVFATPREVRAGLPRAQV